MPGRFSQSRAKRHFRRMEVLHIRPRRFFENKGFCGFAKQNARVQRAGRPQPEAGAVLPSRMPACSGQADPSRLGRGTQAILSGGAKRVCRAVSDASGGKAPHGRHSACLGGLAACCAEAVREKAFAFSPGCGFGSRPRPWAAAGKSGREGAAKGCAPPLRAYKKCTRGPCWGRGCRRAEHRRHSAGLYTINCCVLMDSHTTNIVFTMAHT